MQLFFYHPCQPETHLSTIGLTKHLKDQFKPYHQSQSVKTVFNTRKTEQLQFFTSWPQKYSEYKWNLTVSISVAHILKSISLLCSSNGKISKCSQITYLQSRKPSFHTVILFSPCSTMWCIRPHKIMSLYRINYW